MKSYVDFKVVEEHWNRHKLSDGTTLDTKFVLKRIKKDDTKGARPYCDPDTDLVTAVYPAPSFKGEPTDRAWSRDDLIANIDSVVSVNKAEHAPNQYLLDDGTKILVSTDLSKVSRTTLHDKLGDRIYLVDANIRFRVAMPETTLAIDMG